MKRNKKTRLAVMIALVALVVLIAYCVFPKIFNHKETMTASIGKTTINLKIDYEGDSGKALLYACDANEYFSQDKLKGISKRIISKGTYIGTYQCGTLMHFKRARYKNGTDRLYQKYYLIKDQKIIDGPIYATNITSKRKSVRVIQKSIKGLYDENKNAMTVAKDVGAQSMTINIDVASLIYSNDEKHPSSALKMKVNGKYYYFNKKYVKTLDRSAKFCGKHEMNLVAILLAWTKNKSSYVNALQYNSPKSKATMGFNTSTKAGEGYFIAVMEFLAHRYSQTSQQGYIATYVISNEIDSTHYFYNCNHLNVFMEEYSRALRLANLAVKKYSADMQVAIPFTHYWKGYAKKMVQETPGTYSLRPYDELEWLVKYTNKRGAFDWAIAPHLYNSLFGRSNYAATDVNYGAITGSYKTTKLITFSNFEVWKQYLSLPRVKYKGHLRDIYLTECGISSGKSDTKRQNQQAASYAQAYYKVSQFSFVKTYNYYRLIDHPDEVNAGLACGLFDSKNKKKKVYEVYKYIDTKQTFKHSNPYLKYISFKRYGKENVSTANGKIKTWQDTMEVVKSPINWSQFYKISNIIKR